MSTLDLVLSPPKGNVRRVVRVFISSTFKDMQGERDELVLSVFPQLRKLCESRGVTWGEVDLRWGVTDEQKADGKVLPICLEEIHRCRPYFIGLLGERYGWIPDELPQELIETEPWLQEHVVGGCSVTELEIIHGVLRMEEMRPHAFFYIRDANYSATLPEEERQKFATENEEQAEKLEQLKNKIRRARDEGLCQLREPYADPKEVGKWILEDFTALIDSLFPEEQRPDHVEREVALHEAAAWELAEIEVGNGARQGAYVGREEYGERLDAHMTGNDLPLVITGASGSGKSALLANWFLRYKQVHQDLIAVFHVVGASSTSSNASALLARLIDQLGSSFGGGYFGGDIEDRSAILRVFLGMAVTRAANGRILIVLDGCDKLDNPDDHDLRWLPQTFPDGVRVIVATGPGRVHAALVRRGWPVLSIAPLDATERSEVTRRYLSGFRKELEPVRVERIVACAATANPLYLRTVLDQIRILGQPELLDVSLSNYLRANSMSELFQLMLSRFERDYERDRPGLVMDSMSFLGTARRGLSELELLDVLGTGSRRLPAALWAPIRCALGRVLIDHSGVLCFAHAAFFEAVRARYMSKPEEQIGVHTSLADYFEIHIGKARSIEELPWHLEGSAQWSRLKELLSSPVYFGGLGLSDEASLRRMWVEIQQHTGMSPQDACHQLLQRPSTLDLPVLGAIGSLSWYLGDMEAARIATDELIRRLEGKEDFPGNAHLFKQLADIHIRLGHRGTALDLIQRARKISERHGDQEGTASSLLSEVAYWMADRNHEKALDCAQHAAKISRSTGNRRHLRAALTNCAGILTQLGRVEDANRVHIEEEGIAREMEDWEGVAKCLNNQGSLQVRHGDPQTALNYFTEAGQVATKYDLVRSRIIAVAGMAHAYSRLKEWVRAYESSQLALKQSAEFGEADLIAHCITVQAALLPRFEEHERLEILDEVRRIGLADAMRAALEGQVKMRRGRQSPQELNASTSALQSLGRREEVPAAIEARRALARGRDLLGQNCLNEACNEFEKAESLATQAGAQAEALAASSDLAGALKRMGRMEEALMKLRDVRTIASRLHDDEAEQLVLSNEATLLWEMSMQSPDRHRLEEAWRLATRARQICELHQWKDRLAFVLGTSGLIARFLERWDDARGCFEEQVTTARESGDVDQLGRALLNSIVFNIESSEFGKIGVLAKEAATIIDQVHDPETRARLSSLLSQLRGA